MTWAIVDQELSREIREALQEGDYALAMKLASIGNNLKIEIEKNTSARKAISTGIDGAVNEPYVCSLCANTYKTKMALRSHMRLDRGPHGKRPTT